MASRAAATSVTDVQTGNLLPAGDVGEIDLAPMGSQYTNVGSSITITIDARQPDGSWVAVTPAVNTVQTASVETQMPEATWHYTDADSRKASARTLAAVTGATVTGHASLPNPGADIHIATLVDDLPAYAKPLPLDPGTSVIAILRGYGVTAGELQAIGAACTTPALLAAAQQLLSGSLAESARKGLGFPAAGMTPMSVRALQRFRSSPPVITALAAGLDMRPVDVPPAPPSVPTPAAVAEALQAPRIKAVLESRPRPAASTPAPVRTTVRNVAVAANAPRMSPPRPPVLAGARLITVPLPAAPRPTALAAAGRWRRSAELGTPASTAASSVAAAEEAALTGTGMTIAAGASYVIELPAGSGNLELTGDAGRITLLDRGGRVLADHEASGAWSLPVRPGAALAVAACLGVPAQAGDTGSPMVPGTVGTLTSRQSPAGSVPACGWTASNLLPLVAAQTLLARGSWLVLDRPHQSRQDRVADPRRHGAGGQRPRRGGRRANLDAGQRHRAVAVLLDQAIRRRRGTVTWSSRPTAPPFRPAAAHRRGPSAGPAVRRNRRRRRAGRCDRDHRRQPVRLAPGRRSRAAGAGVRVGRPLARPGTRGPRTGRAAQPGRAYPVRYTGGTRSESARSQPAAATGAHAASTTPRCLRYSTAAYRITAGAHISQGTVLDETLDRQRFFNVEGPRFSLDPSLVAGVFPPHGAPTDPTPRTCPRSS